MYKNWNDTLSFALASLLRWEQKQNSGLHRITTCNFEEGSRQRDYCYVIIVMQQN